jgi:hypothetical protein
VHYAGWNNAEGKTPNAKRKTKNLAAHGRAGAMTSPIPIFSCFHLISLSGPMWALHPGAFPVKIIKIANFAVASHFSFCISHLSFAPPLHPLRFRIACAGARGLEWIHAI